MTQWLAQWWRFILLSATVAVIAAAAKRFLDNWIADGVITFTTFMGGTNVIFDLIGRRSWEEKVAEKDQTINARDQEIRERTQELRERDQELRERDQELRERDQELRERDQEIAGLRRLVEELQNNAGS